MASCWVDLENFMFERAKVILGDCSKDFYMDTLFKFVRVLLVKDRLSARAFFRFDRELEIPKRVF